MSDITSTDGKCFDCISADNANPSVSVRCEAGRYIAYTLQGDTEIGTNVSAVMSFLGGVHSSQNPSTDLSQGGGVNGSMLTIHQLPRSTSEERQTSYDRCNPAKHFRMRLRLGCECVLCQRLFTRQSLQRWSAICIDRHKQDILIASPLARRVA